MAVWATALVQGSVLVARDGDPFPHKSVEPNNKKRGLEIFGYNLRCTGCAQAGQEHMIGVFLKNYDDGDKDKLVQYKMTLKDIKRKGPPQRAPNCNFHFLCLMA